MGSHRQIAAIGSVVGATLRRRPAKLKRTRVPQAFLGGAIVLILTACGSSDPVVTGASLDEAVADAANVAAARKLGLPPNGPDFMYQPPPDLPQLQNRDARFKAEPQMVSGTERYIDGEYQYTDFIYDDESATYPDDFERYGNNAGDLFEFRLSTRSSDSLGFRFTMNSLMVPDSSIITTAFDSDNNPDTGSSTLPRDPGMPFPGTDQVLTTWGTGAEWSQWNGTSWVTTPLTVNTDLEANQITVTVPKSVANPGGQWRATLATGLYDTASGGWLKLSGSTGASVISLPVSVGAASKIINLGFRFSDGGIAGPFQQQDAALAAKEPTRFANAIDFDLLRSGGTRSNVPQHGFLFRVFPSRMKTVLASDDAFPPNGNPRLLGEGKDPTSLNSRFLSPLSPYQLYVPPTYDPGKPSKFTYYLHCDGCNYWVLDGVWQVLGDARNSILLAPSGRAKSGFFWGHEEYDVLEAWADVARHYTLDPTRPSISGGSGGGGGTYQIGLKWPHLFARAMPLVPPSCRGLWTLVLCTGGYETVHAHWAENARNLPIFHIADVLSELTFYPGALQLVQGLPGDGFNSFDELGYRYKLWSVTLDHLLTPLVLPPMALSEFLGDHQIEQEPFHVTYVRMPSNDVPEIGLVHNRAYWLSGIELRDETGQAPGAAANPCIALTNACYPLARGVIDAVSLGFGKSDPSSTFSLTPGLTLDAAVPGIYIETRRDWSEPGEVPVENRIKIKATNIRTITIHTAAARVGCDVKLDIDSDGPIDIKLLGCAK